MNEYSPTIKDYLKWMLIPSALGLVTCGIGGLILMIVWAVDSKNMPRANYFRATLIVAAIGIVLGIILYAIMGVAMFAALNSMDPSSL